MILVDTSVVIDYSRGQDPKLQALLPTLPAAVCGVTRCELLQGSRNTAHRAKLLTELAALRNLPIPEPLWDSAGDNHCLLRSRGVTVSLPDVVIATLGIENDIEVWARDAHFALMRTVLTRLRLFVEPP